MNKERNAAAVPVFENVKKKEKGKRRRRCRRRAKFRRRAACFMVKTIYKNNLELTFLNKKLTKI